MSRTPFSAAGPPVGKPKPFQLNFTGSAGRGTARSSPGSGTFGRMVSLGQGKIKGVMKPNTKVSAPKPLNLPSLKSEHLGMDPTVSLVPSNGTGWTEHSEERIEVPADIPSQSDATESEKRGTEAAGVGKKSAWVVPPKVTPVASISELLKQREEQRQHAAEKASNSEHTKSGDTRPGTAPSSTSTTTTTTTTASVVAKKPHESKEESWADLIDEDEEEEWRDVEEEEPAAYTQAPPPRIQPTGILQRPHTAQPVKPHYVSEKSAPSAPVPKQSAWAARSEQQHQQHQHQQPQHSHSHPHSHSHTSETAEPLLSPRHRKPATPEIPSQRPPGGVDLDTIAHQGDIMKKLAAQRAEQKRLEEEKQRQEEERRKQERLARFDAHHPHQSNVEKSPQLSPSVGITLLQRDQHKPLVAGVEHQPKLWQPAPPPSEVKPAWQAPPQPSQPRTLWEPPTDDRHHHHKDDRPKQHQPQTQQSHDGEHRPPYEKQPYHKKEGYQPREGKEGYAPPHKEYHPREGRDQQQQPSQREAFVRPPREDKFHDRPEHKPFVKDGLPPREPGKEYTKPTYKERKEFNKEKRPTTAPSGNDGVSAPAGDVSTGVPAPVREYKEKKPRKVFDKATGKYVDARPKTAPYSEPTTVPVVSELTAEDLEKPQEKPPGMQWRVKQQPASTTPSGSLPATAAEGGELGDVHKSGAKTERAERPPRQIKLEQQRQAREEKRNKQREDRVHPSTNPTTPALPVSTPDTKTPVVTEKPTEAEKPAPVLDAEVLALVESVPKDLGVREGLAVVGEQKGIEVAPDYDDFTEIKSKRTKAEERKVQKEKEEKEAFEQAKKEKKQKEKQERIAAQQVVQKALQAATETSKAPSTTAQPTPTQPVVTKPVRPVFIPVHDEPVVKPSAPTTTQPPVATHVPWASPHTPVPTRTHIDSASSAVSAPTAGTEGGKKERYQKERPPRQDRQQQQQREGGADSKKWVPKVRDGATTTPTDPTAVTAGGEGQRTERPQKPARREKPERQQRGNKRGDSQHTLVTPSLPTSDPASDSLAGIVFGDVTPSTTTTATAPKPSPRRQGEHQQDSVLHASSVSDSKPSAASQKPIGPPRTPVRDQTPMEQYFQQPQQQQQQAGDVPSHSVVAQQQQQQQPHHPSVPVSSHPSVQSQQQHGGMPHQFTREQQILLAQVQAQQQQQQQSQQQQQPMQPFPFFSAPTMMRQTPQGNVMVYPQMSPFMGTPFMPQVSQQQGQSWSKGGSYPPSSQFTPMWQSFAPLPQQRQQQGGQHGGQQQQRGGSQQQQPQQSMQQQQQPQFVPVVVMGPTGPMISLVPNQPLSPRSMASASAGMPMPLSLGPSSTSRPFVTPSTHGGQLPQQQQQHVGGSMHPSLQQQQQQHHLPLSAPQSQPHQQQAPRTTPGDSTTTASVTLHPVLDAISSLSSETQKPTQTLESKPLLDSKDAQPLQTGRPQQQQRREQRPERERYQRKERPQPQRPLHSPFQPPVVSAPPEPSPVMPSTAPSTQADTPSVPVAAPTPTDAVESSKRLVQQQQREQRPPREYKPRERKPYVPRGKELSSATPTEGTPSPVASSTPSVGDVKPSVPTPTGTSTRPERPERTPRQRLERVRTESSTPVLPTDSPVASGDSNASPKPKREPRVARERLPRKQQLTDSADASQGTPTTPVDSPQPSTPVSGTDSQPRQQRGPRQQRPPRREHSTPTMNGSADSPNTPLSTTDSPSAPTERPRHQPRERKEYREKRPTQQIYVPKRRPDAPASASEEVTGNA